MRSVFRKISCQSIQIISKRVSLANVKNNFPLQNSYWLVLSFDVDPSYTVKKKKKKVIYTYTGGHHVKNVIKKLWGFISKARASAFESIEASYLYPTLSSSI